MTRLVFWSHWHPNSNGTDYWDVLGIYPGYGNDPAVTAAAERDAYDAAMNRYEEPSEAEEEENGYEDEGPDVCVEVYDPDVHDCQRAGGGSFKGEFDRMEKTDHSRHIM